MDTSSTTMNTRKTYPQDWSAYNKAQVEEKDRFLKFLHSLCMTAEEPVKQKNGRPRLPLEDAVFSICYKIYSTMSGRRFMSDLREAQNHGFIKQTPHFNSLFNYLDNADLTPILHDMIVETSLPLAAIEEDFAADSSGFTSSTYSRWYDHKYGEKQQQNWVKVHLMCGVKTHIVTAVEIRGKNANDTKILPDLVTATAKNFIMKEVSGDKAYGSYNNYAAIEQVGATPYIAFKSIHTGGGRSCHGKPKTSELWRKMYHYFQFNREEFMSHYHKRSNVETTFSMIKRKFGGNVRSKTETSMKNEVLCKIICHNICVLINEMHELDISENFPAQKPMLN